MDEKNIEFELLKRVKGGDRTAYSEFVNTYKGRVAATVIGMLGRVPEADDVGQETFIRFFKALDGFRHEAGIATYLTRIAINLSLNELKKQKRGLRLFSKLAEENKIERTGMKSEEENREEREEVREAVLKLKPKFRSVIVLRLLDGYSTGETAELLGVPLGTVLSRLARAQKELRKLLTPAGTGVEYA